MKFKSGFTLIEALIVISILTLMTSLLILYNRAGEFQIILLLEKSHVIDSILRARNLSFGTLIQDPAEGTVCGYGFHIEGNRYFTYRYLVPFSSDPQARCFRSDKQYSSDDDVILTRQEFTLNPNAKFSSKTVSDILFEVSSGDVFFDGLAASAPDTRLIKISNLDETTDVTISINNAGQVSEQ